MYTGGRTETIRSCSMESIEFAKTMLDSNVPPKEKLVAMKKAINAHKDYTVQVILFENYNLTGIGISVCVQLA